MQLRSQAKRQQQQQQQQQNKGKGEDEVDNVFGLPPELMHMLAERLSLEDLAAASMACRSWSKLLRAGITRATLIVGGPPRPKPAKAIDSLAKHSSVSHLQLLLNSRSGYTHTVDALKEATSLPQLKQLHLRFLMSKTPKKGSWPMFFADALSAPQPADTLIVEAPSVPEVALINLINMLGADFTDAHPTLRHLDLKLGQPVPGSQLPYFNSPAWLLDASNCIASIARCCIEPLGDITTLESLRCGLPMMMSGSELEAWTKLSGLTELGLYDSAHVTFTHLKQLSALKSLRRLSFSTTRSTALAFDWADLDHVQDLELGVACSAGASLGPLLEDPPAGLKGLRVTGLTLKQERIEQLAGLTNLTSLHLVYSGPDAFWDLTPMRQVSGLKQLTLQVTGAFELMQIKFAPPPPKPARVLTGACQSVGKRRRSSAQQQQQQQQQLSPSDKVMWGDATALASAWPHLQQLKLSGLPAFAVGGTSWEGLSQLTALTALALQVTPMSSTAEILCIHCSALKQPVRSPGGGLPLVRLEHLPSTLQELQLTSCYLGVPASGSWRAGDALASISLSKCYLGIVKSSTNAGEGDADIVDDVCSDPVTASGNQHPLLQLLQRTEQLRMLELIDLPWLNDQLLTAAGAITQLRGLSSLSVVGVGSQGLTHGALLGLTGLKKLRELRWHVGDVLELMPDVNALAQLKGLMTLHIPSWLHAQMERWGAYAVLDSMPLCDVHVELV